MTVGIDDLDVSRTDRDSGDYDGQEGVGLAATEGSGDVVEEDLAAGHEPASEDLDHRAGRRAGIGVDADFRKHRRGHPAVFQMLQDWPPMKRPTLVTATSV